MQPGEPHPEIKPLSWLVGRWKSTSAKGEFPTIKPFEYCEELSFTSVGQPMLNYSATTWHPASKKPMHQESGFLRIKPGTNQLSFLVAHNFGLTSLEEGNVDGHGIELKSNNISRMSFAKEPAVTGMARQIKYNEGTGQLEIIVSMSTSTVPTLTKHLTVIYEKSE